MNNREIFALAYEAAQIYNDEKMSQDEKTKKIFQIAKVLSEIEYKVFSRAFTLAISKPKKVGR